MPDFNSGGTRVFIFLLAFGIVVATVLLRPRLLLQFNQLQRRYRLPSPALKEKLFLIFVHFMLFYEIYRLIQKIWREAYFYFFRDYFENQADLFKHPLTWLPWLFVGICVLGLIFFKSGVTSFAKKWVQKFFGKYQTKPAQFLLTSLGLISLISAVLNIVFALIHVVKSTLLLFGQNGLYHWWESVLFVIAFLVSLCFPVASVLNDFGLWKRLGVFFRPNFFYYLVNFGILCLEGILFYIKTQKGYLKPSSGFFFWFDRLFVNYYLIPGCYLVLAWLFYRWSWFEKAKVKKDPKLPPYINQEKFWWWIIGILITILIFDLAKEVGWLFWGPGSPKSVMN